MCSCSRLAFTARRVAPSRMASVQVSTLKVHACGVVLPWACLSANLVQIHTCAEVDSCSNAIISVKCNGNCMRAHNAFDSIIWLWRRVSSHRTRPESLPTILSQTHHRRHAGNA